MVSPHDSGRAASEKVTVLCPVCGSLVAVPRGRLADGPKCGRCTAPVLTGRPTAVQGKRLSRQLERGELPLLLDAGAEWCAPCRAFAPIFETVAQRLASEVVCLTLDVDADPAAARQLAVQAVPTLILTHRGRELARRSGAGSADEVVAWARSALADPTPTR